MRKLIYSASIFLFLFVLSTAFYNSYQVSQLRAQVQDLENERTEYARTEAEEKIEPESIPEENTLRVDTATVEQGFYLLEEEGMICVYKGDKTTLYESTSIPMTVLPEKLQMEIAEGKYLKSELELYSFLENYSS